MKRHIVPKEQGFTLTELMVVVAVIAILTAVAVPLLVRDTSEGQFEKGINRVAQEIQRAKFEALSNREDRVLVFSGADQLQIDAVPVGTTTGATLHRTEMPPDVEVAGFLIGARVTAGNTPKPCATAEIRYSAVNDVMVKGTTCGGGGLGNCSSVNCDANFCPCSVTLFIRTANNQHKARIVIYQSTGYSRRIEGW